MKKLIAAAILTLASSNVMAIPTTIVDQGSNFDYQTLNIDLWSNWGAVDYSTVDFNALSGWSNGNAAFGNTSTFHTYWAANTDLALQTEFNFSGVAADLTLNVASDNGFVIFLNGTKVAHENAEGFTSYWEYYLNVDPSLLVQGTNSLQILAEDHGGAAFFDMKLSTSNISPVSTPEPTILALLSVGLLGLVRLRRR